VSEILAHESIQTTEYQTQQKQLTGTKIGNKFYLDVIASMILNAVDDSVSVKSPTTGNAIEPNVDGSINIKTATLESLITEMRAMNEYIQILLNTIANNTAINVDQQKRPVMRLDTITTGVSFIISNFSTGNVAQLPYQLGMGATHIYDRIGVS